MDKYQFYLVEKTPPVARVYLNRPAKKNAMNPPAWKESLPIFEDLDRDGDIRVVVVSGKGDCFSAGIDLMAMAAEIPEIGQKTQTGGVKWRLLKKIKALQDGISCIEWCRKPVIAAVHGYCVGAGLDLATACDVRLCSADAVFCLKEAAVGFVADVGVLQRIPGIVGQGIARELAYTARAIDAERAREIHLVSRVYPDHPRLVEGALELAREIAQNAPLAVQASKDVFTNGIGKSINAGLDYVASISTNIVPSEDLLEAMTAFAEKRKPHFTGE